MKATARRLLLLCLVCLGGCTGTEGDVLLPPAPDLGPLPDLSPPADSAPAFSCRDLTLSGTCQAEAQWQALADKQCQSSGLALASYAVSDPCMQGYGAVDLVCCPKEVLAGCIQETQGDPMTGPCQDAGQWKLLADQACQAGGYVLQSLSLGNPCGPMRFAGVSYLCCPQ